jgi:hypothetical protein
LDRPKSAAAAFNHPPVVIAQTAASIQVLYFKLGIRRGRVLEL